MEAKYAKFRKGQRVTLLDFRHEDSNADNGAQAHFWVDEMTEYIGKEFTIKIVNSFRDNSYTLDGGDSIFMSWDYGYEEHWLKAVPDIKIPDELFEI